MECQLRRNDGIAFWAMATGTLVDPNCREKGSIWVIENTDEQKAAQAEIKLLHEEQQLLFETSMVGIAFMRNRIIERCNARFEEMFGVEAGELNGKSSRLLYNSDEEWFKDLATWYGAIASKNMFIAELSYCRKDGQRIECEVRGNAMDPNDLSKGSIWIVMDIGDRKKAEEDARSARAELELLIGRRTQELNHTVFQLQKKTNAQRMAEARIERLAHYDNLTGLPNRSLLVERGARALLFAQRSGKPVSLLFMDLDNFKHVNDSLGHRIGDLVLVELANRLRDGIRRQDTVARHGGDEFIILLPQTDANGASVVAEKLLKISEQPLCVQHYELAVTLSIGIAVYPKDAQDLDGMVRCADAAMYQAKAAGRNSCHSFSPVLQERSQRNLWLTNALRKALDLNQLTLHFQPQYSLASKQMVGVEALLRWTHPTLGKVSPAEFIPIAESTGLILTIGEWVIRTAATQLAKWIQQGFAPFSMAINLSVVQFRNNDLPALVRRITEELNLPAHLIEFELTEGVAMSDPDRAVGIMDAFNSLGFRMSIDDFGTGYSSLGYLKRFNAHKLKIDQSFIREITINDGDKAIVNAIVGMASNLGLVTLAEGVETEEQAEFLQQIGCNEVQGYLFSRPLPEEGMVPLLKSVSANASARATDIQIHSDES